MTQLYVSTEVIRNMMQHYMLSASSFTVFAARCQARILSADNKTKITYLADEVATVLYVGNKALQKMSCGRHFHI
jgi:galactose mutarotase-like enzyme